jgi:hypothetical protein
VLYTTAFFFSRPNTRLLSSFPVPLSQYHLTKIQHLFIYVILIATFPWHIFYDNIRRQYDRFQCTGRDNNPVYVDDLRRLVERDGARNYLALPAYLDTFKISAEQRFEKQISQWYDLAGRYKNQLLEMKKKEYLTAKRQNRETQKNFRKL